MCQRAVWCPGQSAEGGKGAESRREVGGGGAEEGERAKRSARAARGYLPSYSAVGATAARERAGARDGRRCARRRLRAHYWGRRFTRHLLRVSWCTEPSSGCFRRVVMLVRERQSTRGDERNVEPRTALAGRREREVLFQVTPGVLAHADRVLLERKKGGSNSQAGLLELDRSLEARHTLTDWRERERCTRSLARASPLPAPTPSPSPPLPCPRYAPSLPRQGVLRLT